MTALTTNPRVRAILLDTVVLGALVVSGLLPAPLLFLTLAIPLALVTTFMALNAFFSMAMATGLEATKLDLAARGMGLLAYVLVGIGVYFAVIADPHWSAWCAVAFSVCYVLFRFFRDVGTHGNLFPEGYATPLIEAAAILLGVACYTQVAWWPTILPGVVTLTARAGGDLLWLRLRTSPVRESPAPR